MSVIAFDRVCGSVEAQVLLSQAVPQGKMVRESNEVQFRSWSYAHWDQEEAWNASFGPFSNPGRLAFMTPNPASVFKLMVAVGVLRGIDDGRIDFCLDSQTS